MILVNVSNWDNIIKYKQIFHILFEIVLSILIGNTKKKHCSALQKYMFFYSVICVLKLELLLLFIGRHQVKEKGCANDDVLDRGSVRVLTLTQNQQTFV